MTPRVLQISRQLVSETKSKHSFNSKDSYAVKVLPGQDCAFIIAIACMVRPVLCFSAALAASKLLLMLSDVRQVDELFFDD